MRRNPAYSDSFPGHGVSGRSCFLLTLAAAAVPGFGLAACEEFDSTTDVGIDPTFTVEIVEDTIRLPAGADTLLDVSVAVVGGGSDGRTLQDPVIAWSPSGYVGTDGRLQVPSPVDGLKLVASLQDERYTATPDSVIVSTWALVSIESSSPLRLTAIGETVQLDATARDAAGAVHTDWPLTVTWSSGDETVVRVDATGVVEAWGNGGPVAVFAESEFHRDSVLVEVRQRLARLDGPDQVDALNEPVNFVGYDAANEPYHPGDIRFSSSSPDVLDVDSITGSGRTRAVGTAEIRAVTPEDTVRHTVSVTQTITNVWVDPPADTLYAVDETTQLSAVPQDRNGMAVDAVVAWTSRDELVATVDASGQVTARGPGTVAVVAAAGSVADSVMIAVLLPVDTVAVTPSTLTFTALQDTGRVEALAYDITGFQRTDVVMEWASLDTLVVRVDSTGLMTAIGPGATQVTATAEGVTGTLDVTVSQVVDTIVVTPPTDTLESLGDTVRLTADPQDANGFTVPSVPVTWASDDTLVATVDGTGLVTAVAPGTATVTAVDGAVTGSAVITVDQAVATLSVTPDSVGFDALGVVETLTVDPRDAGGFLIVDPGLTWTSSDTLVVTVDAGAITSVGNGAADITAEADGVSATVTTTVAQVVVGVDVAPDSITLDALADTTRLAGSAVDGNGYPVDGPTLTWESADTLVAHVDADGLVTAVANGQTVVRATSGAGTDSAVVTVAQRVDSVAVTPETLTFIAIQDSHTFTAQPLDALGSPVTGAAVAWSSADTLIATVDSLGEVIAAGPGTTTITATSDGVAGTAEVTVAQVADSVVVSPDTVRFNAVGYTALVAIEVYDENANLFVDPPVTWTSSDTLVATVDSVGEVTAVTNGVAAIVAVSDAAADTAIAVVDQVEAEVVVEPASLSIEMGATGQLTAEVRDSNGVVIPGVGVTWSSNNLTVATVDENGLVTGVNVGSTTVVATNGPLTDQADVFVVLPGLVEEPLAASQNGSTCDLNAAGAAFCWGNNNNGQLGDETTSPSAAPVAVTGGHTFVSLAGGGDHACGLTFEGTAYCWGANWNGQLGDGTYTNSGTPTAVAGGHTFVQITAGSDFSCGVTVDGDGYCWGRNDRGQLGYGGWDYDRPLPVLVANSLQFERIDAGSQHACGLTTAGTLFCWGSNDYGRLGDGTWTDQNQPSMVSGGYTWTDASAGSQHTCGVTASGAGYCWGYNNANRLGSTSGDQGEPYAVSGALTYRLIEAGGDHTCGITTDDQTVCWGYNGQGRLGTGSEDWAVSSPQLVTTTETFQQLALGWDHTCGMTAGGQTWCWGERNAGDIGDGVPGYYIQPTYVSSGVAQDGLGDPGDHACHVGTNGLVYCAGDNRNGKLGDGTTEDRFYAVQLSSTETFVEVDEGGWTHTCGVTDTGEAYCWGGNWNGMLGDGTWEDRHTPALVAGGLTWQHVSAENDISCGVTTGGAMYCWGHNRFGQVGQSDTGQQYNTPQLVDDTRTWVDVGVGGTHVCGLTDAGEVYCWGSDNNCQGVHGDGTSCNLYTSPQLVSGGYTFAKLRVGNVHSCAITTTGEGYCWGDNHRGQLGDGSQNDRNVPVRAGIVLFSDIDPGGNHTCGSKTDGVEVCWGGNDQGDLGTGAWEDVYAPALVAGGVDFVMVRTGGSTSCGVTAANELYCWGTRGEGVFGDGYAAYAPAPVSVIGH